MPSASRKFGRNLDAPSSIHDGIFIMRIFVFFVQFGKLLGIRAAANHFRGGAAIANGHDPIHFFGDLPVMGDDHDRQVEIAVQHVEQIEDLGCCFRIDRSGRFVGQQDARFIGERDGNRDPLLLPA